ncbi:beta-glucosidase family protein [Nocardiopsis lambiniae]|uniref:Glycoside hydrolase family 3 C-terminal domain-containing protein n=1 Tax=Nocardiopsis lambiniae TaxID=3075539 RepID=A0ABU2M7A8_9ACTN|nr:glycoside hydrolase family 3 C-terminal domain-containing protein [Nocardiopsis sp. DSM 44743]MDT0328560.1 glycoside hydrolase family 3 C-terminal domain-containing protein [Nocardiopsis sp. DSM 44743]
MKADPNTLSLRQKASLLTGGGFWSTTAVPEAGIDAIVLSDGPHGVRRQKHGTDHLGLEHSEPATCFPPAVAVGSSWDEEVAAKIGAALAKEARALGVDILLGPGVNIKRSPLGGRNFEYYSEDPLLSGRLATAYVKALQAGGVGASVKHFAANDQETDRMVISADVDERTLREIHLSAFERVVTEAGPATVMCSYNRVNGVPASENRRLLTDVLRGEWGYTGAVISDWGAVRARPTALSAGLDLSMPGPGEYATQALVDAVTSGRVEESAVDRAVERVLALVDAAPHEAAAPDLDAHHALARELAAECAVLLKNARGVLPLDRPASVLVVGEFATAPRYQGGGSSHVNATRVDVPLEFIEAHAATRGTRVTYARGFDTRDEDGAALREAAVRAAGEAEVVVVFAGNPEAEESEGFDRERIELPPSQVRLIKEVAAVAARTVVVLANGGVVSLEEWHDDVDAILEGFLLGQGGGAAIADLLFGEADPSGRLAETIPHRLQDTPTYLSFPGEQGHVRYSEGVMVGYRHYGTIDAPVRYPFGHGLGYTEYEVSDMRVRVDGPAGASVEVTVTNTGVRSGKYVVQVYVSTQAGPVRRPERALAAFTKVRVEPGRATRVRLELDRRAFAYWDVPLARWVVPEGTYVVQVGENAATVLHEQAVHLEGDGVEPPLSLQANVGEWLAHPAAGPPLRARIGSLMARSGSDLDDDGDEMRTVASMPMNQILNLTGGAIDGDWLLSLLGASPTSTDEQEGTHS